MHRLTGVETNYSCHQSESLKINSPIVNTSKQICSHNEEALIFILNDDCLENICRKLPITDQISFALTCQRFSNVMDIIWKITHVNENTNNFYDWSSEMIENFLRVVGKHIKILEIKYVPEVTILNAFSSFCQNVEKLKVSDNSFDTNSMILLIDKMESLESLDVPSKIPDDFFKYLKKFKCLKNLGIEGNYNVTGKNIDLLKDLERLKIRQCFNLTVENFRNICTNLKNLHHLDVSYYNFLKPGDCTLISKNLLQLESLKLNCSEDDINSLTELPKLKKLDIRNNAVKAEFFKNFSQLEELILRTFSINDEVISAVSELKNLKALQIHCNQIHNTFIIMITKLTELEELKLSNCYIVTDRSVLEILEKCLKLKRLDLAACDSLTPFLLKDMIKLLQKQHTENLRKDRVTLTGTYSNWCNKLIRNLEYMPKYSDLIVISLENINDGFPYFPGESDNEYDLNWE